MTKTWGVLELGERVALRLSAWLVASILINDWMIRSIWVFWLIPLSLLWGTAVVLAIFHIGFSLRDGEDWSRKVRGAVAVPLALLSIPLLWFTGVGRVVGASAFLATHRSEMGLAQAKAGSGQSAALPYIEGVFDGGVAIIWSPVPPRSLEVKVQLRLTGERIRACRAILFDAYACNYD